MRVNCDCGSKAIVRYSAQETRTLKKGQAECTVCGKVFSFSLIYDEEIRPPADKTLPALIEKVKGLSVEQREEMLEDIG